MQQLLRFLPLLLVGLLLLIFGLVACNVQQTEPSRNLGITVTQTFDVYQDSGNPNLYHADSTTTSSSYTGTLKEVVEDAVDELALGGGGTISFRAGVFDLGSDFFRIRDTDNIIFEGQGIDVTVVQNSSNASQDTEPFNFGRSNNITIRDLTVSAGGSLRSTSDAIDGDAANNWLIENVKVDQSRGCGIILDGKDSGQMASGNTIRNCIVDGVPNGGIQLLAANNNLVENCTVTNITDGNGINVNKAASNAGQPHKQSTDNTIRNNTIDNTNGDGIRVHSSSRNLITGNTITNSSSDGIQISSSSGISCDDNVVEFNAATSNTRYGLNINNSECNRTVVWDNNDFTGNGSGEINDNGTDTIFMSGGDTEPPTAPTNLTATNVQANQVTLNWNASTDNVGVTAYDIYRDSTKIDEVGGSTTTYQDTTVVPDTTYAYFVRARDAAGNESPQSNTINVTTPPPSQVNTFIPTDDATIRESDPNSNYGNRPTVEVDASSRKDILLRFNVSGVGASGINNVVLRLYATDGSSFGGDFVEVTNNNWNEATVTWNNAPAGDGVSLGSLGSVSPGNWYELDVTSLVSGDGPVSLRVSSSNSNGADYASKENSNGNAPELVVTLGDPPEPDTEPPTAPSNLAATNVQASQVTLDWDASTDNVGVTAYDIYRDSTKIDEVGDSTTAYQDTTVSASTTYAYFVRARDAAGNVSPQSNTINVTTPPSSSGLTFTPTDDATIRADKPDQTHGNTPNIEIDTDALKNALLRFDVSGIGSSSVSNATLRLYSTDSSPFGGDFVEITATSGSWDEDTVTWNNAPPGDGISLGSLGSVSSGNWYELDVTPLVSGDGPVSIRISSSNSNGADYASKENSNGNAPELVVITN